MFPISQLITHAQNLQVELSPGAEKMIHGYYMASRRVRAQSQAVKMSVASVKLLWVLACEDSWNDILKIVKHYLVDVFCCTLIVYSQVHIFIHAHIQCTALNRFTATLILPTRWSSLPDVTLLQDNSTTESSVPIAMFNEIRTKKNSFTQILFHLV